VFPYIDLFFLDGTVISSGFITGKTIAIYLVDKEGKRREISPKVFRPKQGQQAKTANTLAWSEEMQECFDSKNNT
jgi:hypothetical protein